MPLIATFDVGKTIQQHHFIETISDKEIEVALQKFIDLQALGVLTGKFEDNIWYMNNETETIGINFEFNEVAIHKQKETTYNKFVLYVKYYMCLCFGNYTLVMYKRIVNGIKNAVNDTDCFTKIPKIKKSLQLYGVEDFLSLLPWVDEKFLYPVEENSYENIRRRTLAEYQSYFIFNDIISDFWTTASKEEKDLFYPMYLWWNISMIIPVRVTEFTVIPKDCLKQKENRWFLTIRRTNIKGKTDARKRYKLETDYRLYSYEITDKIASDIIDYKKRQNGKEAEIDSLFSDILFVESKGKINNNAKQGIVFPHMRNVHFGIMLDLFNIYVVEGKYNYTVIEKELGEMTLSDGQQRELRYGEMIRMNLGDTRHIALQNLLLNGCNILMAREISGHDTVDMIFHYSGNMKNLVKCKAYGLYQHSKQKSAIIQMEDATNYADIVLNNNLTDLYLEVDDGRCYSQKFVKSYDASDCYTVNGNCSICSFHKGKIDIENICNEQEKEFEDKVARVKIWMNSAKKLKDKKQLLIATEKMKTSTKNLEMAYLKLFEKDDNYKWNKG